MSQDGGDLIAADESLDARGIGYCVPEQFTARTRRHGSLGREQSLLSQLFIIEPVAVEQQHESERLLLSEL